MRAGGPHDMRRTSGGAAEAERARRHHSRRHRILNFGAQSTMRCGTPVGFRQAFLHTSAFHSAEFSSVLGWLRPMRRPSRHSSAALLALAALFALFALPAHASLSCLDESGSPVGWFVQLKVRIRWAQLNAMTEWLCDCFQC